MTEDQPETEVTESQAADAKPSSQVPLWDLLVGVVPFIAISPMMLFESATLWSREYMRFIPITLLAVIVIVSVHFPKAIETRNPYRRWTAIGMFVLAICLYLFSAWQFSPWLSHLALVIVFGAWALGRFGNHHWATPIGWTILFATTMRLPAGWDEGLLSWLQGLAAWGTAAALDAFGIPCLNNGTLIETRGLFLAADEICGGWISLFAFISIAVLLLIIQHRSVLVSAMTLVFVFFWAWLSNFIRLLAVALTYEFYGRDLSAGWDFRLLEAGTCVLVLLLIWMSTYLFARLYEPIPVADAEFGPVFSALNKSFLWPQPDPLEEIEPEDEYERKEFRKRKQKKQAQRATWKPFDWRSDRVAWPLVCGASALVIVSAVLPVGRLASQGITNLNFGLPSIPRDDVLNLADENSMPAELDGGWVRVGFERVRRNPRSGFGEYGITWNYQRTDQLFSATLDLPFLGWHNPVAQRGRQGWTVQSEEVRTADGWVWCEAELENELGGSAFALYCLFTSDGQTYSKLPLRLDALRETDDSEQQTNEQTDTQVTYQFQVFIESGERLSRANQQRIRDCFLELRNAAVTLPTSQPNTPPAN